MNGRTFDTATPSSSDRWRHRLTGLPAVGVVLLLFWAALLASVWDKSATYDEIGQATAGYTYWRFRDYRLDPENGNLPQRWIGLSLLFGGHRFPSLESAWWKGSDPARLGHAWFNTMGNDVEAMLRSGRAASALWAVALGGLVWWWARRLFGPTGGMLSLLLYVLNPAILANGPLMTSDTAAAFFLLASATGIWGVLHRITWCRVLGSGALLGCLLATKLSGILIVPISAVLAIARVLDGRPLPVSIGRPRALTERGRQLLALGAAAAAHVALAWGVVWMSYGFRYEMLSPGSPADDHPASSWEYLLDRPTPAQQLECLNLSAEQRAALEKLPTTGRLSGDNWSYAVLEDVKRTVLTPEQARRLDEKLAAGPDDFGGRVLEFAKRHRLLPEAYLYGAACVRRYSVARKAFLNGEVGLTGWRCFFPYTFAVKTPLPLFGVMAMAAIAGACLMRRRETGPRFAAFGPALYRTLPLWTLLGVYWTATIASHLNIGHRHLLPVYGPLFALCGCAAIWFSHTTRGKTSATQPAPHLSATARVASVSLALLVAACVVETASRFPNYLAYFNGIVRPAQAYRHLVDSSLDWGQDLPALKRYLDENRSDGTVYLSYFGTASPLAYGIHVRFLPSDPGFYFDANPLIEAPLPNDLTNEAVGALARQWPERDIVAIASTDGRNTAVLLKKPETLRLSGGTYVISATLLQPLYGRYLGGWNANFEAAYQALRTQVQPFLSEDRAARGAALRQFGIDRWQALLTQFEELRFGRLRAYLRQREPDGNVNYSILVYRLDDAEIARALEGPPAELGPDLADTPAAVR